MKTQRETPEWLANKMVDILINEAPEIEYEESIILEPSCGSGNIINSIESAVHAPVIGVELNKELSEKAKARFGDNDFIKVINGDFLNLGYELVRNSKIKHVIMLPPFKNMVFIDHIKLIIDAWGSFKDECILISLVHNGFWTDNSEICVGFRELINDDNFDIKFIPVPDNTFIEKRKSVPCSIMVLRKS